MGEVLSLNIRNIWERRDDDIVLVTSSVQNGRLSSHVVDKSTTRDLKWLHKPQLTIRAMTTIVYTDEDEGLDPTILQTATLWATGHFER